MYENYRKINLIQGSHPPREILGEKGNALSNQLVYSSMNRNVIESRFFFFFFFWINKDIQTSSNI